MRPFIYTALGDSLTASVGSLSKNGFVQRYTKKLIYQNRIHVIPHIYARPKITSTYLKNMIFSNPTMKHSMYHSKLITITIGGNDLLQANRAFLKTKNPTVLEEAYKTFYHNIYQILQFIHKTKQYANDPNYLVQLVGVYNPYPKIPYGGYWVSKFNHGLSTFSSKHVRYVDIHSSILGNERKLLGLGIHPNGKGYEVIANKLYESFHTP